MAEEIDEGDLQKQTVYNQLPKQDSTVLKLQNQKSLGNLQHEENSKPHLQSLKNKFSSQEFAVTSEMLKEEDEGVNKRPNPSPFKGDQSLQIPRFLSDLQSINQQSSSSRNNSRRGTGLDYFSTLPHYADNYNILRMSKMKSQDSHHTLDLLMNTTLSLKNIDSNQGQKRQMQKKQLNHGSRQLSNKGDQDTVNLTKRSDSAFFNDQQAPNPTIQGKGQYQSETAQSSLFKIPNKKSSPMKPLQKQYRHTNTQQTQALPTNNLESINTSLSKIKTTSNAFEKTQSAHKAMFLSPPMKQKKQDSSLKKKKLQNTQQIKKGNTININSEERTPAEREPKTYEITKNLKFFEVQDVEQPFRQNLISLQTSESEKNLNSPKNVKPFDFSVKSRSAEIEEHLIISQNEGHSSLGFNKLGQIQKEDSYPSSANILLLDESNQQLKLNLNYEKDEISKNGNERIERNTAKNSIIHNESSVNKSKPQVINKNSQQKYDTPKQRGQNTPKLRTTKAKKSSKNLHGCDSTKRIHSNMQTSTFAIESFRQVFEQNQKKSTFSAKKQTVEQDNPLKTPRMKKDSVYQHSQVKKLQEDLDKVKIKAKKRKIEIIELKDENLKLRAMLNHLLQVKLNEN